MIATDAEAKKRQVYSAGAQRLTASMIATGDRPGERRAVPSSCAQRLTASMIATGKRVSERVDRVINVLNA